MSEQATTLDIRRWHDARTNGRDNTDPEIVLINLNYTTILLNGLEAFEKAGWRSCIDHIIKPDNECPVCRFMKAEAFIKEIGAVPDKWKGERGRSSVHGH